MSVLSDELQNKVKQALVEENLVTQDSLDMFQAQSDEKRAPIFETLLNSGAIGHEDLTRVIAKITSVPYVDLSTAEIDKQVLELLPREIAERYMAVPLGQSGNRIMVGMLDADNVQAADFIANKIGKPLKVYMASEVGIKKVLRQYDVDLGRDVVDALGAHIDDAKEITSNNSAIKTIVQDSPISKALSTILEYASNNRASDIHIEPMESFLKIRCRVDGVLKEIMTLPKMIEAPLISRIKILSSLKIDEHRIPQDGQFSVLVAGNTVDLRIAISPVVWGEQAVIRLLDKSDTALKLESMGYLGRALQVVRSGLGRSNGMLLTSGPTGSGKSTSMYALIQEINREEINIVTLEDPVEYKIKGVNQIQVNNEVGLTFASGLRSILRQDPNVIMVGEIRDKETANLAVQSALTGHMVFSTLHTNSAAGILPRLIDMDIEPFLIASTVHTVIGQRLVRRLSEGSVPYTSSPAETQAINATIGHFLPRNESEAAQIAASFGYSSLPVFNTNGYTLYQNLDKNGQQRYRGRLGLYEAFTVDNEVQQLIMQRKSSNDIQELVRSKGMVTIREDGYLKALAGMTSIREVDRVAASEGV
jgi:type IV pilus assembly protein PilB